MLTKITLFITLVLTVPVCGQSVESLKARIKKEKIKDVAVGYDKFRDQTLISTTPKNLIGNWEGATAIVAAGMGGPGVTGQSILLLTVRTTWRTQTLSETPADFELVFTSSANNWVYLKGDNNVYFLLDGERLELHPIAKDSGLTYDPIGPGVGVSEEISFRVTRDDLQKVATAKKVELRLGNSTPRIWKPEWSKRFEDLLALTVLGPHGTPSP